MTAEPRQVQWAQSILTALFSSLSRVLDLRWPSLHDLWQPPLFLHGGLLLCGHEGPRRHLLYLCGKRGLWHQRGHVCQVRVRRLWGRRHWPCPWGGHQGEGNDWLMVTSWYENAAALLDIWEQILVTGELFSQKKQKLAVFSIFCQQIVEQTVHVLVIWDGMTLMYAQHCISRSLFHVHILSRVNPPNRLTDEWHSISFTMHCNDVIVSATSSQITSLTIVYSIVYSRRRSKKTSTLLVTGLCEGNSPVTGEFPTQRASNAENVSLWWRHHDINISYLIYRQRPLDYSHDSFFCK